ncbi:MAG: HemK family protein methyltransferase [Candidatus Taylorbacteria bacterium]|nr:HemK family protein methyltransferase [Candidatus Taylorbacteria bacterium]
MKGSMNMISAEELQVLEQAAQGDPSKLHRLMVRRQFGESLSYVVGKVRFCGREFCVDRRVYIPNVETEQLVRLLLREMSPAARIIDVGTGSGAIAITIQRECPKSMVYGVDIDPNALEVARANAAKHKAKVRFVESYYLDNVVSPAPDAIIADIPYGDPHCQLSSIVWNDFEQVPRIATFHPDGRLTAYQELIESIVKKKWHTVLYIETGKISKSEVSEIIPVSHKWKYVAMKGYSVTKVYF